MQCDTIQYIHTCTNIICSLLILIKTLAYLYVEVASEPMLLSFSSAFMLWSWDAITWIKDAFLCSTFRHLQRLRKPVCH